MSDDLKLVEQFEKETGITLERVSLEKIGSSIVDGFAADDNGRVRGLSICEKKLRRLPALLSKFQRLEKLVLYKNQISDISNLNELKGLTNLSLSSNQIKDISSLKELKGLTVLDLSRNQIRDISSLKELKGLTTLYLYNNQISDISILKELMGLTVLSLFKNQISDISSLKELKNLKNLLLMGNKITHMPAEFLDLGLEIKWEVDSEDGIFLEDNPLESPPVEIIKKGNEAIRQYFKSLEGEKQALNEVKVLLVGDGAAGKTSLVKRLLGQDFDKNESQTHGININTMDITQNNNIIKIRLWNFGGQEIMHATHQFFLSKRSLYILVLDGRKDEKTEYWLNHIKSFGGDSPVMVAINKIDENPGFDVNRRHLKEKYPNIKGFYPLSCKSGNGIDPLKKALTNELARVELIRTTWPKSWFNVKNRLEKMKEDFIDYETYRDICAGEKIDREAMETLVAFLNDLGVILHFKEYLLEETQVLRPQWLTGAVYKIVTSKQLSAAKGLLNRSQLKEILTAENEGDRKYPESQYKFIIGMMKKFELCYTLENDRDILVPDLLEVGEPEIPFDSLDSAGALKFLVSYYFLPPSVMPRLIVRLHRDIKDRLRWRSGVVLENRGFDALAVVKSDDREQTITMAVTGAQRREYLAVILNTLREINAGFDKIDVSERVPLPDNPGIGVDYHHLLQLERMGEAELFPEKATRRYNVKELLDGIKLVQDRQLEVAQLIREGKIEINLQQIMHTHTEVHTEVNVEVNISVNLPALQTDFEELKDLLVQLKPDSKEKLNELSHDLDALTSKSEPEKMNGALNRVWRFLNKLMDKDSEYHKKLSGAKAGLETLQKAGRTYNKVAQWIPGLPVVPDVFL
ncbi:MAG: leucine-rich repeat domain-containing protein [Candidatus Aminicenantes bacterium]|nr:leucine-rich repeat domain-containing protein [Candidatus Aminicenantes bacterium]